MTIEERARALFETYAAATTNDARAAFVFAHPPLLAKLTLATIRAALADADASRPLAELERIRAQLDGGQSFPLGSGPVESAWSAAMRGEISLDRARVNATDLDAIEPFAYPYAKALSRYAYSLAGKDARGAFALQTLLVAATEAARQDAECLTARVRASMDFLFIAVPSLVDVPDGRIYRRALELGAWLETRPERLLAWPPGELDFALGVLNLDPYLLGGDVANYARSYAAWQYRRTASLGPQAATPAPDLLAMPEPLDALALAIEHLEKAVATQTGEAIATAQKALAQAVALRAALGGAAVPARDEPRPAPIEVRASDPSLAFVALAGALDRGQADVGEVERTVLALDDAATLLARVGPNRAVQAVLDGLALLERVAPARGFAFLERYRALVDECGAADARQTFWKHELAFVANEDASDARDTPGALVRDLGAAQSDGREGELIARLDALAATHAAFLAAHADAFEYLRFVLVQGVAGNAYRAQRWTESIEYDGLALSYCLNRDFADAALIFASRVDDLASKSGVAASVTTVMAACALRLEAVLGERGLRLMRSTTSKVVTGMIAAGALEATAYLTLLLATTGPRLGSLLRAHVRPTIEDERLRALLGDIAELERAIGPHLEELPGEETVLASFVESSQREDGAQAPERLRNLARAFDARFDATTASHATAQRPTPLLLADLRALLDESTVLLHYYLGAAPDGRIATVATLIANDDIVSTCIVESGAIDLVGVDLPNGVRAWMPPLGFAIGERRTQVRAEPGPRTVDRDGGDGLTTDLRRFLGPFVERLAALRERGKTRLWIVPYGPLHFYPWALLGGPNAPLGATWTISIAPSLSSLVAPRRSGDVAKTESTVVGLSFAQPGRFGLPPIPLSAVEANAVAAIVHAAPLLEADATKAAVLAALRRSRRAHLSTHGRHAVYAAAFSSIFLADDGAGDAGRLCAYEIAAEDLRGCELVTLSACETALGRYDLGDNVRGLAAAFFLAGVETIVATLWPVRADATATFFPALYAALEGGAGIAAAFASAQAATRSAHPKLRDWGGFYLLGRPT